MKLGMEVGLGPGDIVLDGDPALPRRGAQPPIFGPTLSPISATAEHLFLFTVPSRFLSPLSFPLPVLSHLCPPFSSSSTLLRQAPIPSPPISTVLGVFSSLTHAVFTLRACSVTHAQCECSISQDTQAETARALRVYPVALTSALLCSVPAGCCVCRAVAKTCRICRSSHQLLWSCYGRPMY